MRYCNSQCIAGVFATIALGFVVPLLRPPALFNRIPFPGPALAARVIGEVTPERIAVVRKATAVVERILKGTEAFQYMAILHQDRVTGMRDNKRDFGFQIEIRCWDSLDV